LLVFKQTELPGPRLQTEDGDLDSGLKKRYETPSDVANSKTITLQSEVRKATLRRHAPGRTLQDARDSARSAGQRARNRSASAR
jgi:hypothetical protein